MRTLTHLRGPGGATAALTTAARQTTGFNAAAGFMYPCDTTSAAFTATLPSTPTQGDRIGFYDVGRTWNTNNLTVGRNGNDIAGAALNLTCNVQGASIVLVWDATRGWSVTS